MNVLIVLYESFTEYEYEIPALAFHHLKIPFEAVGLESTEIIGMIGMLASSERTLLEVDPNEFSALLLPGIDRDTSNSVMGNQTLLALIREFDQQGKLIGAICAAPLLLAAAGILKGRRFCSDIRAHPAFWGAVRLEHCALRDGNLVTGLGGVFSTSRHYCWRRWWGRGLRRITENGRVFRWE